MNTVELDRGTSDSKYVFAQKKKKFMSKLKKKTPILIKKTRLLLATQEVSCRKKWDWRLSSVLSHWIFRSGLSLASGWWRGRNSLPQWEDHLTLESETPYPKYSMMSYRKENPVSKTIPISHQTKSLPCLKWSLTGPNFPQDLCCVYFSHHCSQHPPNLPPTSSRFTVNMPCATQTPCFCTGCCLSQKFLYFSWTNMSS